MVAVAVVLPLWFPRPLLVGEISLAFAVPFALVSWALLRPAYPGSLKRALDGGGGRGLWLEAICIAVILILAIMSMLVSPDPFRAFRVILPMLYAFCALLVLARVPPFMRFRLLYAVMFASCLALGLALMLTQVGGRSIVMRDYRFMAFFENPNQLGVMILAVWPLAIALLLNASSRVARFISLATVLVLASSIFISGTKTALALGFLAAALMWLYNASRSGSIDQIMFKMLMVGGAIALAAPATLWILSWANPDFLRRVDTILKDGVWQFQSMVTRNVVWDKSIEAALDHPVLGVGAGTRVYRYSHSHNIFIDYFRGMGVFALIASLALVLSAVARGANFMIATWHKGATDRAQDMVIAGLYCGATFYLLANMLSDSMSPTTSFIFWMMYLGAYLAVLTDPPVVRAARRLSTRAWTTKIKERLAVAGSASA